MIGTSLCCSKGFFAVQQKSERLITYYMILSSLSLILRGIVTLLLIISYETIEKVLTDIFEEGEDVASIMTLQYVVILIVFVVIEILLSLMSLVQGSQSKEEYARK
jgi:NADH:ubiquinone oxidoreductase subunit 3 (subunit A)